MKFCFVVGTRPEIIKMAPVIKEAESRGLNWFLIHSNQHYSQNMDEIFFEELELRAPDYNLEVGSAPHGNQTGNIMIKMEPILAEEKPDILLTQGDTNTVLASAMVASKMGIKVGHVEAGLRSYDRTMPEETNRIVTDHISEFAFAVTNVQKKILQREGISDNKIFVVGNTIVDSVNMAVEMAERKSDILDRLGLERQSYVIATLHRSSNVDYRRPLESLMAILDLCASSTGQKVVWPMHPRTQKSLNEFGINIPSSVQVIDPVGYLDFTSLLRNANFALTDSGGIQEEACILGVPCITCRENTERPETIDVGANLLVGTDNAKVVDALNWVKTVERSWENPFGDGKTAKRILDVSINS